MVGSSSLTVYQSSFQISVIKFINNNDHFVSAVREEDGQPGHIFDQGLNNFWTHSNKQSVLSSEQAAKK